MNGTIFSVFMCLFWWYFASQEMSNAVKRKARVLHTVREAITMDPNLAKKKRMPGLDLKDLALWMDIQVTQTHIRLFLMRANEPVPSGCTARCRSEQGVLSVSKLEPDDVLDPSRDWLLRKSVGWRDHLQSDQGAPRQPTQTQPHVRARLGLVLGVLQLRAGGIIFSVRHRLAGPHGRLRNHTADVPVSGAGAGVVTGISGTSADHIQYRNSAAIATINQRWEQNGPCHHIGCCPHAHSSSSLQASGACRMGSLSPSSSTTGGGAKSHRDAITESMALYELSRSTAVNRFFWSVLAPPR